MRQNPHVQQVAVDPNSINFVAGSMVVQYSRRTIDGDFCTVESEVCKIVVSGPFAKVGKTLAELRSRYINATATLA
jgi:hypothetical protein